MRWRRAPGLTAAEVTGVVLVVAIGAQWRHLASCPHLTGHAVGGQAVIAEAPGDQAAVHAWPVEHLFATRGKNLHGTSRLVSAGLNLLMSLVADGLNQVPTDEQLLIDRLMLLTTDHSLIG